MNPDTSSRVAYERDHWAEVRRQRAVRASRSAPRECRECGGYGTHESWCDKTK